MCERPCGPKPRRADRTPRRCRGCSTMVKGWTYCTRCRRRVRAGETLDDSDCLTVADSAAIWRYYKRRP